MSRAIYVVNMLLEEEPLPPGAESSPPVCCSWCKRWYNKTGYINPPPDADVPWTYSHGCCPKCSVGLQAEIDAMIGRKPKI